MVTKDLSTIENPEPEKAPVVLPESGSPSLRVPIKLKLGFCLLVLAAALFLRLYNIGSIPEGLFWDEAINGEDTWRVIGGQHPIFFTANNGREPLFIYMQTLSVLFFGSTAFALRIVSALVGIATVIVEFFFVSKLLDRNAAIVATLGLAASYWHISESRIGFRAILVPLMAALVFYCLWSGMRSSSVSSGVFKARSTAWFLAAGGFLGLSLYTYLSARFIPVIIVVFLCFLAIFNRALFRKHFVRFVLLIVTSLVVFAPLGIYFLQVPEAFYSRAGDVLSVNPDNGAFNNIGTFLRGLVEAIGAFWVRGDSEWRHNLPGKPAMDFLIGFALFIGISLSISRFRRPQNIFLLLSFFIMLLPSALATDNPHYLRAMGALPSAYALVGLAVVWLLGKIRASSLIKTQRSYTIILVLTGAVWLWLGPYSTWNDYFNVWAKDRHTLERFEDSMLLAKQFLSTVPQSSRMLIGAFTNYPYPDIKFGTAQLPNAIMFDGPGGLLLGQGVTLNRDGALTASVKTPEEDTYYAFTGPADRQLEMLKQLYPAGSIVAERHAETGYSIFSCFLIPAGTKPNRLVIPQESPAFIGQSLELLGYDNEDRQMKGSHLLANAGDNLELAVYSRVLGKSDKDDYVYFLHLIDGNGRGWAQSDVKGYPSIEWQTGDFAATLFKMTIPPGIPTGKYLLRMGMYSMEDMKRAQIFDKSRNPIGDALDLAEIKITGNGSAPVATNRPLHDLGGKISLQEAGGGKEGESSFESLLIASGDIMSIRLVWRAEEEMTGDYTVFLQLLDSSGRVVAQDDGQPQSGEYPTSFWDTGETVVDDREILLPQDLAPGKYKLIAGMYLLSTGERLKVDGVGDSINLGTVTVGAKRTANK